jgi:penicillin-binding protein 2
MNDSSRVRISMIGVVIVALFAALLARLWFLQVGPDRSLAAVATRNGTRVIQTDTARGRILDRNGIVLAEDQVAWAVTVDRNLSKRTHQRVMGQLSETLGTPIAKLEDMFNSLQQSPLKPAIVALDVSESQRLAILERQEDFPGVGVTEQWVRTYPAAVQLRDPTLAAQVLGFVGQIDASQLKALRGKGYAAGDEIGKDGIEQAYESWLRGRPELQTVEIDPTGKQVGAPIKVVPGRVGRDVYLTLDARIQQAAESALASGMTVARTQQNKLITNRYATDAAPGGAVVVMNANDGSVVAMASNPAFPPSGWVGGIAQSAFNLLNAPASNNPLLNRATEGTYAPGSTFKLVTSVAATRYGIRQPGDIFVDNASVQIGGAPFANDGHVAYGPIDLQHALTVSSDTYFYTIGNQFWINGRNGVPNSLGIQQVAREFGFGAPTGIELSEASGRIPDPTWKRNFATAFYKSKADQLANSVWYPGDNVHLAVGQGDVLVTPLQLADAYASFSNGGTVWTPHVGMRVVDPTAHRVVRIIGSKPRGHVTIPGYVHDAMWAGFTGAVNSQSPRGTAYDAFLGIPVPVAGKTGTAQVNGKAPTSVFVAMFSANGQPYVAVAMVEQAGYGADIAAPIVRQVVEAMNGIKPLTKVNAPSGQHD